MLRIYTDYSPASHVITGVALKEHLAEFRVNVLKQELHASWHYKLVKIPEGKGWTIKKEKLDQLLGYLGTCGISYDVQPTPTEHKEDALLRPEVQIRKEIFQLTRPFDTRETSPETKSTELVLTEEEKQWLGPFAASCDELTEKLAEGEIPTFSVGLGCGDSRMFCFDPKTGKTYYEPDHRLGRVEDHTETINVGLLKRIGGDMRLLPELTDDTPAMDKVD
jgi:hypothetical protein